MRYPTLAFASVVVLSLGACASCAATSPLDAGPPAAPQGPSTMPALTISAVDTTANTLTITAHGLNTGDGPAAVRNIGGALPAATPALGPVLDRFAIRVDANTIKLAASNADAIAGTPIDITSAGSGTNVLEIGVPYRIPRTYGPGVQLKSDDLNANFDSWVALYDFLTGQSQSVWNGMTLVGSVAVGGGVTITGATTANGELNIANKITESGVISATLDSALSNDDFSPTGIGSASIVRMSTSAGAANLGGLNDIISGNRIMMLVNVASVNITILHESLTSSSQFRFLCPNSANVVIRPNGAVRAWHDVTSLRWRLLAI